jgi:hypothetical protein
MVIKVGGEASRVQTSLKAYVGLAALSGVGGLAFRDQTFGRGAQVG